jgi:hypothetical protein
MLQVETGRRDFLTFLGLLTGLSAAQAAKAADPYEVGGKQEQPAAAAVCSTNLLLPSQHILQAF